MVPTHWVVCKYCGKKFDVEKKGGYFDGTRYICKSCGKMIKKQAKANTLNLNTNSNDTWFKKYWKILFGVFFLIGGFGNIGQDWEAAIFGVLTGAGLLFYNFYPQIKAKNQEKEQKEAEQKARAEERKNCKACGAQTKGDYCEFCGSRLD